MSTATYPDSDGAVHMTAQVPVRRMTDEEAREMGEDAFMLANIVDEIYEHANWWHDRRYVRVAMLMCLYASLRREDGIPHPVVTIGTVDLANAADARYCLARSFINYLVREGHLAIVPNGRGAAVLAFTRHVRDAAQGGDRNA